MDNEFLNLYVNKLNEEVSNLQKQRLLYSAQVEYMEKRLKDSESKVAELEMKLATKEKKVAKAE